jgi:O-antigen/teichoic acid export membrane protein
LPPAQPVSVEARLLTSAFWITAGELVGALASMSSSVVSARVLSPRDFGLLATALLTLAILDTLSQSGFEQALVQREADVHKLLNAAWSFNLLRGMALSAILTLLSSPIASFYAEPRLGPVLLCAATVTLLRGAQNIGPVLLTRELNFSTHFRIRLSNSLLTAVIGITAVLLLRNVWALCIALIGNAFVSCALSYVLHPYRPRFELSRQSFLELLRFGRWVSWSGTLVFVATQGDDLFVSKYLGLSALGVYQLAYAASNLPATQIAHVVSRLSLPAYARLQSEPARVRNVFLLIVERTLTLAIPASVLIWCLVPDFVRFIVGDKWQPIIPLVRILVLAGLLRAFAASGGAVFQALGRPELDFRMQVPRFMVIVLGIYPAAALYGLSGVCWICLASILACLPQLLLGVHELLAVRTRELLKRALPGALLSVPLAGLLLLADALPGVSTAQRLTSVSFAIGAWIAIGAALARAFGYQPLRYLLRALGRT